MLVMCTDCIKTKRLNSIYINGDIHPYIQKGIPKMAVIINVDF